MNRSLLYLLFFAQLLLFSCSNTSTTSETEEKKIAITYRLIANGYQGQDLHKFVLLLENKGAQTLTNSNWELYFNHSPCRKIMFDSVPANFKVTHINGDFFKITPTDKFQSVATGQSIELPIISELAIIKYTDAPRGFYFVFKDEKGNFGQPQAAAYSIAPFDKNISFVRGKGDITPVPTAASRFEENKALSLVSESELPLIIPTPIKAEYGKETIKLTSDFQIHYGSGLKEEADFLANSLNKLLNAPVKASESNEGGLNIILLQKKSLPFNKSKEAYSLTIAKEGISITGNDNDGVFYAIQSLRALIPVGAFAGKSNALDVRVAKVEDAPQFEYRGMYLDAVRNFHTKESILKLIDNLSFYKMNVFRIHIADDEGWRLEIKELPELTEVSSKRGHSLDESTSLIPSYGSGPNGDLGPSNGYYSQKDFIEILKYAKARHVQVIPSLDVPGHARAAMKAMDVRYKKYMQKGDSVAANKYLLRDNDDKSVYSSVQLFNDNVICPCQEGIYNFLTTVTKEIKSVYKEADAKFTTLHVGGDEVAEGVWTKSPVCDKFKQAKNMKDANDLKKHFFTRVNQILAAEGLQTSSFEDIAIYKEEDKEGHSAIKIREEFPKSKMNLHIWDNVWGWGKEDIGYRLANSGYPIILANVTNLYFDLAYSKDPEEPGFYWGGFNDTRKPFEYTPLNIYNCAYHDRFNNPIAPETLKDKVRLTPKGLANVKGLEGLLWSETVKGQNMMEWYIFPKLISTAERAWSKTPAWSTIESNTARIVEINKDWNLFANALGQRELPRLDYMNGGVNYMLPAPGVKVENGMVKANTSFPGLVIRYTTDGSLPTKESPIYTKEIKKEGTMIFATFSSNGRASRVVEIK